MKKIISLALAVGLLVSANVQTADAKISAAGSMTITGEANTSDILSEARDETSLKFYQRFDLSLDATISDEVSAKFQVRVPHNSEMTKLPMSDPALNIRAAYLNFPLAIFDITAGVQSSSLPGYLGSGVNPLYDDPAAGFVASTDLGMIVPQFSWFMTEDTLVISNIYALQLPVGLADGMTLTPWVALDDKRAEAADTYIGATFDAEVNALTAGAGVLYVMTDAEGAFSNLLISANVAMDLGALTPGVAVWYGVAGADGFAVEDMTGTWNAFNGTADNMFGNGNGLQSGNASTVNAYNSLGIMASLANIALGDTTSLGAHVIYAMDNTEDSEKSEFEFGASLYTEIAQGLEFILDAAFTMPMDGASNDDATLGTSVAATISASF